jgi:ribonuclease D
LFRLNKDGIFEMVKPLLENPEIIKVGLSVHDDYNALRRRGDIEPAGFIDLQDYARTFHIADISLQKVYAIVFGGRISKSQRLTNWEADTLTEQQQIYAAIDAWACLKLYRYMRSGAFHPAESPYARETEIAQAN